MAIVNQGAWCQATVSTGAEGIRAAAGALRKEGYEVSVSSLGVQVTKVGRLKMSIIDIRKGANPDTFGATAILRNKIPELNARDL